MSRVLASGDGWSAADVACTSGPDDPFEERHAHDDIASVLAGSFQYCSRSGRAAMAPGSLTHSNHAFRSEFGVSPREHARHAAPAGAR
ncbi:MAG: hypothetical protein ACRD1U_01480 [Vicinamibacterales bacterium]